LLKILLTGPVDLTIVILEYIWFMKEHSYIFPDFNMSSTIQTDFSWPYSDDHYLPYIIIQMVPNCFLYFFRGVYAPCTIVLLPSPGYLFYFPSLMKGDDGQTCIREE
jgi:hypothetical protein